MNARGALSVPCKQRQHFMAADGHQQVEIKLRLPDKGAYDKVTSLLAPSKTASYAQVSPKVRKSRARTGSCIDTSHLFGLSSVLALPYPVSGATGAAPLVHIEIVKVTSFCRLNPQSADQSPDALHCRGETVMRVKRAIALHERLWSNMSGLNCLSQAGESTPVCSAAYAVLAGMRVYTWHTPSALYQTCFNLQTDRRRGDSRHLLQHCKCGAPFTPTGKLLL